VNTTTRDTPKRNKTIEHISYSIRQTWYGFLLIYTAIVATGILLANLFDWKV
jgi:hypothetical protein